MHKRWMGLILAVAVINLPACGGGDGARQGDGTGQLSVGVTDAPVDNAAEVTLKFQRIGVKPENGDEIVIDLAQPQSVNLLQYTDGETRPLLTEVELAAGRYQWMRLYVDEDSINDSYLRLNDGSRHPIDIPSGRLHLNRGFVVPEAGLAAIVVDFDLRKALVKPSGQDAYTLKPVIRLVRASEVGHIVGRLPAAWLTAEGCTGDLQTGAGNAVYAFEGSNVVPDDMDTQGDPIATAQLRPADDGTYRFVLAYLPPGDYTLAFTCQARGDHPETQETIAFFPHRNASVLAGETTTANMQ